MKSAEHYAQKAEEYLESAASWAKHEAERAAVLTRIGRTYADLARTASDNQLRNSGR